MPPSNLEKTLSHSLDRRRKSQTLRSLTTPPPGSIDFSSNDFLSLATNPELHKEYVSYIQSQPAHLGSGGSRLLDGNSSLAESLERSIADFHHAPTGLLCNSGFDANVGFFSCIPQPGDAIVYDEYIHASVHDGIRASSVQDAHFGFLSLTIPTDPTRQPSTPSVVGESICIVGNSMTRGPAYRLQARIFTPGGAECDVPRRRHYC